MAKIRQRVKGQRMSYAPAFIDKLKLEKETDELKAERGKLHRERLDIRSKVKQERQKFQKLTKEVSALIEAKKKLSK